MLRDIPLSLDFLHALSSEAMLHMFWYTLLLELPRYLIGAAAFYGASLAIRSFPTARSSLRQTLTAMIVGHNEADALERAVRSLHEQSRKPDEIIIVSDGSTDATTALASRLQREGLVDHVIATDLRGGKSSGLNLALRASRGDIVVNLDGDCSYDRFALERIAARFDDPDLGAATGDLIPRNRTASLVAQFQSLEYLVSISIGRVVSFGLNQVSCVSGAFSAFRRVAIEQVGGCDAGGGEDLDITLRLRAAGWGIAFARDSFCYTDVPIHLWALLRQRLRWERDAFRLRCRKHRRNLFARSSLLEIVHQWDFLVFELGATLIFPFYLAWLFWAYGAFALPILVAMQLALVLLDLANIVLASLFVPRPVPVSNLLYVPGYSVFASWIMRPLRFFAYLQEWLLFGSRNDNYVPAKVRLIRKW